MKACQALVIEDDRELGELIVEVLTMELDCDVKLIQNGAQALAWLSSDLGQVHVPTLVVLDVHLPGASGLEILDLLRSTDEYRNACIVMSSSDSILLDRAREKADLLVLKPVAYSHFVEICRWFRTSVDIGIDCRETVKSVRL